MTTVQCSFVDAPALPFVPNVPGDPGEINEMLAGRFARPNHRRYHYPSLSTAMVCLLATTCSLLATSHHGEKTMASWVPPLKETVDQACTAVLGDHERGHLSLTGGNFR